MPIIRNAKFPGMRQQPVPSRSRETSEEHPIGIQIKWFIQRTGITQTEFCRIVGYNGTLFERIEEGRLQDRTIHKIRQAMKHHRT